MIPISADMREALRSSDRRLALLAEIEWIDETHRLWSGVGDLAWSGSVWRGIGSLGSVSGLELTGAVGIQKVELKLAGIPGDTKLDIPDAAIRGRRARLWLAALTPIETVIATPTLLATITMSHALWSMTESGDASLTIVATAGIWQHEHPTNRVWSAEEQKRVHPGDTGFDQMTGVAGKTLKWSKT